MKSEAKTARENTFTSPFALEAAATRLKNVVRRGVYLDFRKLDGDHVAFQMTSRYRIGIVGGSLTRDGQQTLVKYTTKHDWLAALRFGLIHAYPTIPSIVGVPLLLWWSLQALAGNKPFEVLLCFGGIVLLVGWLLSAWRIAFKEQDYIAQIPYVTLRDPIPDIPDISRS
jgi:hypothetical protein